MRKIDITGERFDFVDLSEGYLFFDSFSEGEKFKVKVWGATVMKELEISDKDSYIAALSYLEFDNAMYIDMNYGIYSNTDGTDFIKNIETDSTDMQLELGKKQVLNCCNEYVFGGILGRNIGYAEIKITCKGKINLLYDENALIDATCFCMEPQKYRLE